VERTSRSSFCSSGCGLEKLIMNAYEEVDRWLREEIEKRILSVCDDKKRLPCSLARRIAEELEVKPITVGKIADQMGIKISACELGCF
jgi:hypothetical protein